MGFAAVASVVLILSITSCGKDDTPEIIEETTPSVIQVEVTETAMPTPEPENPWTDEKVYAMALTLAGECYEDKPQDKRLVCEVILNRVSTKGFPDTVIGVVSQPNQFNGYWKQSRDISEDDIEIATQALRDWYDNNCQPLSSYLYFSAGENRENEFREEF